MTNLLFSSPTAVWCVAAPSVTKPEERAFVVDSGASMHMLSRKDLFAADLETLTTSRSPTTVVTANGEVQTNEEATVYVKELDLFVRVKLPEDTPAVLSLGTLCDDHGYSYEWTSGQLPHLITNGRRIQCSTENRVPIVVPWSTGSSSSSTPTSPASFSQDPRLHPATIRSESSSGPVQGDLSPEPPETEKPHENEDTDRVRGDPLHDLPEWLEEFKVNLVAERVPEDRTAPASSSRESASKAAEENGIGQATVFILSSRRTGIAT